ncbi:hypothetical protein SAMN05421743_11513 [Thalassobacillus cyri]|uniref:Uncharacterized protein n=1 Tax=Thalassobacillus cyri TaxID=571932 RepID=A0A1H4GBG9_9BACI|nr:hypothetical protein SAMN05421743_11513 [Thalassobacillus cyri]
MRVVHAKGAGAHGLVVNLFLLSVIKVPPHIEYFYPEIMITIINGKSIFLMIGQLDVVQ